MRRLLVVLTVMAGTAAGVGGTARAAPLDPFGYVRLLHGDLGVPGQPVAVAVDGQAAGQAPWAGASPWRPVPPGRHRLTATGGTDVTVEVGAGCGVTVVSGQADLSRSSLRAVVIPDCIPARLGPGQARITAVVVTSPSFGRVEVDVNGGRKRVEPHTVMPGTVVMAGEAHVTIRHPDTGAVFLKRDVHLDEGTAYTLALVGGGEAGATLTLVEDAAQARVVPAPDQPIHTGAADRVPLVPLAVVLGAALSAVALRMARRGLSVGLVAVGLLLTGCRGPDQPAVATPPVEQPPVPTTSAPPPVGPTQPAPHPPPTGPSVGASPAALRIASLGVELPVGRLNDVRGLPRSLALHEVAWLTGTAAAGAVGTTAILGHTGSGPFGRLGAVRPGDPIIITDSDGRPHTYRTVSVLAHDKEAFPQEVWDPQRVPTLVLITCTGGRDPRTGLHVDNLVVRAIAA